MSTYSNRLQPALQMLFSERPPIYASCMMILGGITEQHVIIAGFRPRHWIYEWFSQFHSCGTYSVLSRILGSYSTAPANAMYSEVKQHDIDSNIQPVRVTLKFHLFEYGGVSYTCKGVYFHLIWSFYDFPFWTCGPQRAGQMMDAAIL